MRALRTFSVRGGLVVAVVLGAMGASAAGCGNRGASGTAGADRDGTKPALIAASALGGNPATQNDAPAGFTRLVRSAHPLARPELDRGPLDPGKRITNVSMMFAMTPAQKAELESLKESLIDPRSPSYHKFLTPEQYASRFGAKPEDIRRARAWLTAQGFDVNPRSRLGTRVTFSGSVEKLQNAFHTTMHQYQVGGETHYAMAKAPAIPNELAGFVGGLHNTHDFHPRASVKLVPRPETTNGKNVGLAPPDWASVYDVAPLYTTGIGAGPLDGTGITVVVVGIAAISSTDVDEFRSHYGLPATKLTQTIVPNTGAPNQMTGGAGVEAFLDVEWSGGIATGATVNYVYTGADDGNVDDATAYAIEENLAPVLSESFGGCEAGATPSDADFIETYGSAANALGITYLASSGDSGAAGCVPDGLSGLYTSFPNAYPGVTSVGGTEFTTGTLTFGDSGIANGYSAEEQAWDEADNPAKGVGAGGGGISNTFPRPFYQSAIPTCAIVGTLPTTVTPSAMRQVPDISAAAASAFNPYFVDCTLNAKGDDCGSTGGAPKPLGIGGTSASSPSIAGVITILNQAVGERLGNINPLLYTLSTKTPAAFHDITAGNNEVLCTAGTDTGCAATGHYGYVATAGYDCATGLGSLDATKFVTAVAALGHTTTTLVATPLSAKEGDNISMTATLATKSNGSALTGTVSFSFVTTDADGGLDLSWDLGDVAITGGTTTAATAVLPPAPIPVGFLKPGAQFVDVLAEYSGDAHHIGSFSAKTRITLADVSLTVSPATSTVAASAKSQFTAAGGVAPYRWFLGSDGTCDPDNNCSTLDENTGAFVAGPLGGAVQVLVLDKYSAEAQATVTVTAPPDADAGATDAGTDAGATSSDAGTTPAPTVDSGAPADDGDAGDSSGSTGSSGGCAAAAGPASEGGFALFGFALGGLLLTRRRRASK